MTEEKWKLPLRIANLAAAVGSIIMIVLIVGLFWLQPRSGTPVKSSISSFSDNADQYFSEDEAYNQINDNIKTYQASGRPD
ncbi:MAG: hypothetical protein PHG16_02705 [Lachnospiraceae bacterium]|nr:hypothetical protein [Lachnospiraceae bacterium]